jgi:hypothetical protein
MRAPVSHRARTSRVAPGSTPDLGDRARAAGADIVSRFEILTLAGGKSQYAGANIPHSGDGPVESGEQG